MGKGRTQAPRRLGGIGMIAFTGMRVPTFC
jgi:hypothetical protein